MALIVKIAQDKGVTQGRRMRVDTTVVETNIHYPTDSSLLGDGVRVLIRAMKRITKIAGAAGAKVVDIGAVHVKVIADAARTIDVHVLGALPQCGRVVNVSRHAR